MTKHVSWISTAAALCLALSSAGQAQASARQGYGAGCCAPCAPCVQYDIVYDVRNVT
ncbi:MAG TPA: hypothetical protein VF306_14175 [Pirellulales bacterium]